MRSVLVVGDRTGVGEELPENLTGGQLTKIFNLQRKLSRKGADGAYDHVVRADDPCGIAKAVTAAVGRRRKINMLDIADHGRPGLMRLGKHVLFAAEEQVAGFTGADALKAVAELIEDDGCIRLLGCRTGALADGRALLRRLRRAAGGRLRVYGTIGRIQVVHFHLPGFLGADDLLYSSDAAIDYVAPTGKVREENLLLL